MSRTASRPYVINAAIFVSLLAASVLVTAGTFVDAAPIREKVIASYGGAPALKQALVVWWLFTVPIGVGLLIQHRRPVAALILVLLGAAGHVRDPHFDVLPVDAAVAVVLYTLATLARARWVSATAVALVTLTGYLACLYATSVPAGKPVPAGTVPIAFGAQRLAPAVVTAAGRSFQILLVLIAAAAIGDAVHSRRAHVRALEERAADAEREQRVRSELAAAGERAMLTRELHDVVAHGLSVMVVQAQGAAAALNRHPDRTATALQHVIDTGRGASAEMRRLLGLARTATIADPDHDPSPGVGALPVLLDRIRSAGTRVRFDVDGDPVPLPASVDLSAYRIVQEALTNTLKHAGDGAQATVRLGFGPGQLDVEVTDDGPAPGSAVTSARPDPGYGLRGIAERVSLLGGELAVGPHGPQGFQVRARLPFEAVGTFVHDGACP